MKGFKNMAKKAAAVVLSGAMVASLIPAVTAMADEGDPVSVRKIWQDDYSESATRPDEVSFTIDAIDGSGSVAFTLTESDEDAEYESADAWLAEVDELGADESLADYAALLYECDEEGNIGAPEGYTVSSATVDADGNINIINAADMDITVTKEWDDEGYESERPESVTIYLNDKEAELTEADGWEYTFTDMPVYDNEDPDSESYGTEIAYSVSEEAMDNYTVSVSGSAAEGFVITNTYIEPTEPEITTNIAVSKVWDDDDDAERLRPDSVSVTLYNGDGAIDTEVLSKSNGWRYEWTGFESGSYYVNETAVPEYYEASVSEPKESDVGVSYTITNTCTYVKPVDKIDIEIEKQWNDGGARHPNEVTVVLYCNGEPMENIAITKADDWMNKVHELDSGEKYAYTIKEIVPDGYVVNYELSYDSKGNEYYTVVNYSEEIADELGIEEDEYIDLGPVDEDESVPTGDVYRVVDIVCLIVVIGCMIVVIILLVKDHKNKDGGDDGESDEESGDGSDDGQNDDPFGNGE